MRRLHSLDMFRGFAIVAVLLSHIGGLYEFTNSSLLGAGRYGVVLFYIVSGFTIFYVLTVRDVNRSSIASFYIHRFFRIAPLFYFLLLFVLVIEGQYSLSSFLFFGYLDFENFNRLLHVEWSIYVEVLFYICAPYLFLHQKFKTYKLLLIFIIISIVFRYYFYQEMHIDNTHKQYLFFNPINYLYTFFVGAFLFKLIENVRVIKRAYILFSIVVAILFIILAKKVLTNDFYLIGDYLFSVLFSLIIYYKFKYLADVRFRAIELIGLISYSLYLWHYIVLQFLSKITLFNIQYFDLLLDIIIVLVISTLSFYFIEKPGVRLGKVVRK